MTTRTTFIPSIDFRVWSSQLGTIDSFTDDLLKRLDSTINTKSTAATLTAGIISSSTISQGSLSTLDDEKTTKSLSIISQQPVYMEKTLQQSCQSFECFNNVKVKEHDSPSTSAAAAAAAIAAVEEERRRSLASRKSASIHEKNVIRKSSAYFSQTIRKIKSTPTTDVPTKRRPSSPGLVIKSKEKEEQDRAFKKPTAWWRKLFSRA